MVPLEEGLRHFWLPGIHAVKGSLKDGLARWIEARNYTISFVTSDTEFSLKPNLPDSLIAAFAHDSSRMACAAFETFLANPDYKELPRSCGWTNISSYYGAFFAAHSLLRMFGTSCIQLEAPQVNALGKVANALNMSPPNGFQKGFYIATYDKSSGEVRFVKSAASSKGSHGILWELFDLRLRAYSNDLITISGIYNEAALFLADIANTLCQAGHKGTWLSHVRNAVNYRQEFGAWFPYKSLTVDRRDLLAIIRQWQKHPQKIQAQYPKSVLGQHVATCTAIASICYLVVTDMNRIGGARSFHSYGAIALVKHAGQAA